MTKLNTKVLKEYIVNLVSSNTNISTELDLHELDGTKITQWVRTHKSKVKTLPFELDDPLWDDLVEDGWAMKLEVPPEDLIGGVLRYFQYKDEEGELADAVFAIVTDSKDEKILYWSFNID